MARYLALLRRRDVALFFGGSAVSQVGDAGTLVALVWLVLESSGSPGLVSGLIVAYTAPVALGGIAGAALLDALPARRLLVADNALRGIAVASVPAVALAGDVATAHLFAVAATYGLLRMVSLAGIPTIIARTVEDEYLDTANALEQVVFALGATTGPALAGALLLVAPPEVFLAIDAATYAVFAAALALMRGPDEPGAAEARFDLRPALRLIVRSPPILATTLMFFAFNVGDGIFLVAFPFLVVETLGGASALYGGLLAAMTAGMVAGTLLVGSVGRRLPLGRAIAAVQVAVGATFALLALVRSPLLAAAVLFAAGVGTAPLTVWAQTLRMRLIPADLRGRVFALLRTSMQAGPPVGGALAGALLGVLTPAQAILVAAACVLLPGGLGFAVRDLRRAGEGSPRHGRPSLPRSGSSSRAPGAGPARGARRRRA